MINKTIVALDQMNKKEIFEAINTLHDFEYFKLGLEIFNQYGRDFIHEFIEKTNKRVFLDLKLHDIPKTVECAIKGLEGLKVDFLTIHLSGGRQMIRSAMSAKNQYLPNTKVLGVSYLTSLGESDFNEIYGIKNHQVNDQFKRIFTLAAEEKIDGLISSPHELSIIKSIENKVGHQFIKITPGIRFPHSNSNDQKRFMGPAQAFDHGANYIVMGRAITKSENISETIKILKEI